MLVWYPKGNARGPEIIVPPRSPSILEGNRYYEHYIRHPRTQEKFNRSHSKKRSYTRVIDPFAQQMSRLFVQ